MLAAGCGVSKLGVRTPTAAERAAIVDAQTRHLGLRSTRCVRFGIVVARADQRFARVSESFHPPFSAACSPSNGLSLYKRTATGWHDLGDASDPFPCGYRGVPTKVLQILFGECS